jgi:hypothetical protein
MMPDLASIAATACADCIFFTLLGLPLARLVPGNGVAALGVAPALGWAAFTVLALPILSVAGFKLAAIGALAGASLCAAVWGIARTRPTVRLPRWALPLAWGLAVLPALAIVPKPVSDGLLLAPPMFDHVKIAMVDSLLRSGLPIRNPFFGPPGHTQLSYYYLWHFGAAVTADLLRQGGWTAEGGMTWFTAFASLLLVMALAQSLGGRRSGCALAALLCLPGSLRPLLAVAIGRESAGHLIPGSADFGDWLNQAAWVPQHLQSACCVVLSVLLIRAIARRPGWVAPLLLALVAAAGFESSAWVGGIAFAAVAAVAGTLELACLPAQQRVRFAAQGVAAAFLAALIASPFLLSQMGELAGRQGSAPIALHPYGMLGDWVSPAWRTALDVPAFWLLLPFEMPALVPLGGLGLWAAARGIRFGTDAEAGRRALLLAACTMSCLAVAWLFRSTIDNNDLGWRAVLPPVLILPAAAAVVVTRLVAQGRWVRLATAGMLAIAGLPAAADLLRGYAVGQRPGDPAGMAGSAALWNAVRAVSGPEERIANNPRFVAAATPWPVNISSAVLSDRPSCYGNWETVLAYGGVSRKTLEGIEDLFKRVFDGTASAADIDALALRYDCALAVLVPADGAWNHDPFAAGADYVLTDPGAKRWRIYRRRPAAAPRKD